MLEGSPEAKKSPAENACDAFFAQHKDALATIGASNENLLLARRIFIELFTQPKLSGQDLNIDPQHMELFEKMKQLMGHGPEDPDHESGAMAQSTAMDDEEDLPMAA